MSGRVYTVTANPSLDYIMYFDTLHTGTLNRSVREAHLAGGKGINVARVLQELEIPVTCLGFTAGYVGEQLTRMLEAQGVRTDFTVLPTGCTRINVKAKTAGDGETELNGNGPDITAEALTDLKKKAGQLKPGDVLVLSGSIPAGLSRDLYGELGIAAVSCGAELMVDAEKDLLFPALACRPLLVKPNREELEQMLGRKLNGPAEIREGMEALRRKGARNVLLSMGGAGAYFLSEENDFCRIEVPRGKIVNTVGAGDSMVAGFLAKYLEGESAGPEEGAKDPREPKSVDTPKTLKDSAHRNSLTECAVYAAACGSACAFQEDLPHAGDADAVLPAVKIVSVAG